MPEKAEMSPAHAKLQMEVRGETKEVNEFMKEYVYDIFAGVDKAYRVKSKVELAGESYDSDAVSCYLRQS